MSCYETIRIDLHNLKELPPLTDSSRKLLDAINNPDVSLDVLCGILDSNPSVTARLLVIANSAYFGYRGAVGSIRQAIIQVLGIKMVKSVALGILVSDALDTSHCANFSSQRYWFSAVTVAALSKKISETTEDFKALDPDLIYTAGLLHNIGLLALVHKFPILISRILDEANASQLSISEILQREYSLDQYQSGGWLAERWQFPKPICISIKQQRNLDYGGEFRNLVVLLNTTASISKDLYSEKESSPALATLASEFKISESKASKAYAEIYHKLPDVKSLASQLGGR